MVRDSSREWHVWKNATVWTAEAKLAVRLSIDPIAFLVNRSMMPATQEGQVRERGGAALSPVADVMALPKSHVATRKATSTVAVVQRTP
jgi:hypothetical protein